MKYSLLEACRSRCKEALISCLISLIPGIVAAQTNFIKNPDFEQPLGPDNWTVVYTAVTAGPGGPTTVPTNCGPWDFLIAGRSSMANKDKNLGTWDGEPYYWDKHGGCFAPNHDWLMHAYFKQVVTGLQANASYIASAWMGQFENNDNYLTKCTVYLELVGGFSGTVSKVSPNCVTNVQNNATGWTKYSATNAATPSGQLEVRLHFNKFDTVSNWEYRNFNAYYDHVSLIKSGTTITQPPYSLVSLKCTNSNFSLRWQTVMNNRYRIQVVPSLSSPIAWSYLKWNPYLDTYLDATGSVYTYNGNLPLMFSYNPSLDPAGPVFFRIYSETFQP